MVQLDEEDYNGALVPTMSYYEEEPKLGLFEISQMAPSSSYQTPVMEQSFQMDHNTLWFIANGGMGQRPQQPPALRQFKPASQGPFYDCGGDHWIQDCPSKNDKRPHLPPLRNIVWIAASSPLCKIVANP